MSSTPLLPNVSARFDALCRAMATQGRGSNLRDLGMAYDLAVALEAEPQDRERVEALAERLGLRGDVGEVA